jgi:hypothetical protein
MRTRNVSGMPHFLIRGVQLLLAGMAAFVCWQMFSHGVVGWEGVTAATANLGMAVLIQLCVLFYHSKPVSLTQADTMENKAETPPTPPPLPPPTRVPFPRKAGPIAEEAHRILGAVDAQLGHIDALATSDEERKLRGRWSAPAPALAFDREGSEIDTPELSSITQRDLVAPLLERQVAIDAETDILFEHISALQQEQLLLLQEKKRIDRAMEALRSDG